MFVGNQNELKRVNFNSNQIKAVNWASQLHMGIKYIDLRRNKLGKLRKL